MVIWFLAVSGRCGPAPPLPSPVCRTVPSVEAQTGEVVGTQAVMAADEPVRVPYTCRTSVEHDHLPASVSAGSSIGGHRPDQMLTLTSTPSVYWLRTRT